MPGLLALFAKFAAAYFIVKFLKVLASIGIAFASYKILSSLIDSFLNNAINSISLSSDILALLHIGKVDEAISIVFGAIALRASLSAMSISIIGKS